jgi:tRNA A37 threonylcarbamoyltransferase TsaD
MPHQRRRSVAQAFMRAAFAQVEEKVALGVKHFEQESSRSGSKEQLGGLVVSGGVASNQYLRRR